jgi:hypothetical protein
MNDIFWYSYEKEEALQRESLQKSLDVSISPSSDLTEFQLFWDYYANLGLFWIFKSEKNEKSLYEQCKERNNTHQKESEKISLESHFFKKKFETYFISLEEQLKKEILNDGYKNFLEKVLIWKEKRPLSKEEVSFFIVTFYQRIQDELKNWSEYLPLLPIEILSHIHFDFKQSIKSIEKKKQEHIYSRLKSKENRFFFQRIIYSNESILIQSLLSTKNKEESELILQKRREQIAFIQLFLKNGRFINDVQEELKKWNVSPFIQFSTNHPNVQVKEALRLYKKEKKRNSSEINWLWTPLTRLGFLYFQWKSFWETKKTTNGKEYLLADGIPGKESLNILFWMSK